MGGGNAIVREGREGRERSKEGNRREEWNGEKDEAECMLDSMDHHLVPHIQAFCGCEGTLPWDQYGG